MKKFWKVFEPGFSGVVQWALFTMGFAVMPFIFEVLERWHHDVALNWVEILGNGELCLAGSAVAAVGIGDALFSKKRLLRLLVGGFCALFAYLGADVYSTVVHDIRESVKFDHVRVMSTSIDIFCVAGLASCVSLLLGKYD
ncbi:MAG: hypothetical protein WDN28_13820 [Chthoniobacter sp.]